LNIYGAMTETRQFGDVPNLNFVDLSVSYRYTVHIHRYLKRLDGTMATALAVTPLKEESARDQSEHLGAEITELCSYIYAAEHRLLTLIRGWVFIAVPTGSTSNAAST
jgi:hypothetical protein